VTSTNNQTLAIACGLATLLGALRALEVALMYEISLPVFFLLDIIMLIAFIMMIKKVRSGFMVAMIIWIILLITYFAYVSMDAFMPWWLFFTPVFNISYLAEWLIYIAGIYFAYKSYMELK